MKSFATIALASVVAAGGVLYACGGSTAPTMPVAATLPDVRIPRAPGEMSPSLVAIDRAAQRDPSEVSEGTQLSDTDTCATCHPDAAAQWQTSAHSFASFGNPIYRTSV
ncbi:MAG TPA: hypothetical protein VGM39_12205, partial [Kofleriaceae bacterium]